MYSFIRAELSTYKHIVLNCAANKVTMLTYFGAIIELQNCYNLSHAYKKQAIHYGIFMLVYYASANSNNGKTTIKLKKECINVLLIHVVKSLLFVLNGVHSAFL